jgi:hypothetical protein
MKILKLTKDVIDKYLEDDYLLREINNSKENLPVEIVKTREFGNMIKHPWKRAMFDLLYGDLKGKKVLDIGGAFAGSSKFISENNYTLVDPKEAFSRINLKYFK